MAPSQRAQLERVLDKVLKSGNVQELDVFLEREAHEGTPMKCSQQFLTKLDKLINRSLDQKDVRAASLGFASLYKCGKYLKLPGAGQGLSALITQGLIKKWFEKCKQLWIQCGPQWDEALLTLSENFLNALMIAHKTSKEGTYEVTESFLYPVGQLAVDPRIYILIQREAIRKYNLILDKIPVEIKKNRKILASQEASDIMTKLAGHILEGGDYDLQSSLMEALCRMATPDQRKKLADQWFTMGHVASAFAQIHDSEFETACRGFLNMVNGMQGDKRRVLSFPCLEVYLGKYELLMPSDEKLEEFWIDFNLGSHSISFYFSLPEEEEGHWETICINENEVQSYTVKEEGKRQVLQINLSEVVVIGAVEGSSVTIHFSSSLDILQAACSIYGHSKNKCTTSGKAAVKTVTEGNTTEVVPESQTSVGATEKNTAPYSLPAPSASAQMVTPAKMKISVSTTIISSSGGELELSGRCLASKLATKDKDNPSLEKFCSRDKTVKTCSPVTIPGSTNAVGMKGQKKSMSEAIDTVATGQKEEKSQDQYFIPDTQPIPGRNISSSWRKLSVSEILMMPTQKMSSLPRSECRSSLARRQEECPSSAQKLSVSVSNLVLQKQFHKEVTQRLQQVLNARNQDPPPQEPTQLQRNMTNRDSKDRGLGNLHGSSSCSPKVQQSHRKDQTKEEVKGQTPLEADAVPTEASVKSTRTRTIKERIPPKTKDGIKTVLSSKQKRDAEIAGSMMKHISSHHEVNIQSIEKATTIVQYLRPPLVKRPVFNMSWKSTGEREKFGTVKLHNKTTTNSIEQNKDIFEFSVDSPLSVGGKKKPLSKSSSILSNSIKNSTVPLITTKKEKSDSKKRYVKKHLFSDTDTDNAMTEISWLRESTKKPKPKVTKYPRQPHAKPIVAPPLSPHESPDLLVPSPEVIQRNDKPSKKTSYSKKALDPPKKTMNRLKTAKSTAAPGTPHATGKRPRRAAALSLKSYLEPDTDDSLSEAERTSAKVSSTDYSENTKKACEMAQTRGQKASKQPTKIESVLEMQATSKNKKYFEGRQEMNEDTCSEIPPVKKRKKTLIDQSGQSRRQNNNSHSGHQVRAGNVPQETSKLDKKNITPAQEQMRALKDSLAACQTSFCQSPPFIEKMRSAESLAPIVDLTCSPVLTPRGSLLPTSPKPPCKDTPSPILLLPKLHSRVSSKGKCKPHSFYSTEKSHSSTKTKPVPSGLSPCSGGDQSPAPSPLTQPSATEMCAVQQHLSSAPQSPLSPSTQPLLTSTLLEKRKPHVASPQLTFPEDTISQSCLLEFSKVSSGSLVSPSQSFTKSSVLSGEVRGDATATLTVSPKSEKTSLKDVELDLAQHIIPGPSRKRHDSLSSKSEEDDDKEKKKKGKTRGRHSPRMKPRKLFKSFVETSTVDEFGKEVSSSHMSSSHWEPGNEDENMDMDEELDFLEADGNQSDFFQQLSSEINSKFQFRGKMLEIYNKHSSETVQQHVSSINVLLAKHRTQKLEQVKKLLIEEIHIMEQDEKTLKSMEKDLTMHWTKQTTAFHSYQKQEIKRNETLGRILQSQACNSLEYEEGIFSSEMALIKKDMKSVQDKFLKDMLEGEIHSVKKGLETLFFP